MRLENPTTLEDAQNVLFHTTSLIGSGDHANSSVPDSNSDRLVIDTSKVKKMAHLKMISVNLRVSASSLSSMLLDVSELNTYGTNWINYDLRSFENDFEISDFSDTSFILSFGTLGSSPITIVDAGDISSSKGFIQIDNSDIIDILDQNEIVFSCN